MSNSLPQSNLIGLAAVVIPLRQTDLREKLKGGCKFIPMPLTLGWEHSFWLSDNAPRKDEVPGLLLSDIKSGAVRQVRASWMHSLYQHSLMKHPRGGATILHLSEASYSTAFSLGHLLILLTLAAQFYLAVFSIAFDFYAREGWLVLAGLLVRVLQAICADVYPASVKPRKGNRKRYFALHTGMTTMHILVIAHQPIHDSDSVHQLEDSATPLPRIPKTRGDGYIEYACKSAVQLLAWTQKAACVVTNPTGILLTAILVLGSAVTELLYLFIESHPAASSQDSNPRKLTMGNTPILDSLTAICQETNAVSCGFLESILPDPTGKHEDYTWISRVKMDILHAGEHPSHPKRDEILQNALRRRTSTEPKSNLQPGTNAIQ